MTAQIEFQSVADNVIAGIRSLGELKKAARLYLAQTQDWETIKEAFLDAGAAHSTIREFFAEKGCIAQ